MSGDVDDGRRGFLALLACACLAVLPIRPLGAEAAAPGEYQVKAAYLINFTLYVEWPAALFGEEAPFVIGVLGDDPFGEFLERGAEERSYKGHPIEVRRSRRLEDLGTVHLLFVSRSESSREDGILRHVHGSSTLTVGESRGFLDGGGMIQLVLDEKRVRFEVNLPATEAAGLKISAKLLNHARAVRRAEG